MPVEIKRLSDFPKGDVVGNIEPNDLIKVTFERSYNTEWFLTDKMLMSSRRFSQLLKETGAKPSWKWYGPELTPQGQEIKDSNGKVKKKFYAVDDPTRLASGQRSVQ